MSKRTERLYTVDQIVRVYLLRNEGKSYSQIAAKTGIKHTVVPSIVNGVTLYIRGQGSRNPKNPAYGEAAARLARYADNTKETPQHLQSESEPENVVTTEDLINELEKGFEVIQRLTERIIVSSVNERTKNIQQELHDLREYKKATQSELESLREFKKLAREENARRFGSRLRKGLLG